MAIAIVGEIYASALTANAFTVPSTWLSGANGDVPAGSLAIIRIAEVCSGSGGIGAFAGTVSGTDVTNWAGTATPTVGQTVTGGGFPAGTTVTGGISGSSGAYNFTCSQSGTTGSQSLTLTNTYGATDDAGGNTWYTAGSIGRTAHTVQCATLYCLLSTKLTGGTTQITITYNGGSFSGVNHLVQLTAFSGVTTTLDGSGGTSTGVDQTQSGTYASNWTTASGSGLVTANANDLLVAVAAISGGGAGQTNGSPTSPFTDESTVSGASLWDAGNSVGLFTEYAIVSSTGTYAAGGNPSGNENGWTAQLVAFQASGDVAPSPSVADRVNVSDVPVLQIVDGVITVSDLEYDYSANTSSLGGAISTGITSGQNDNVFADVSAADCTTGKTYYACIYVKNKDASTTWSGVKVWIDTTPAQGTAAIALDDAAAGATATSTAADINTAPSPTPSAIGPGTSRTWHATDDAGTPATSKDNGILLGDIPPSSYRAVWLRRIIPASATADADDAISIRAEGSTPT